MKTLCTNYLMLRLALLIAPFAVVTGTITGGLAGIQAATTATVNNAGHIQGVTGSGIIADIAVVTNENSGAFPVSSRALRRQPPPTSTTPARSRRPAAAAVSGA